VLQHAPIPCSIGAEADGHSRPRRTLVSTLKFVYWQDGDFWLGYLQDWPDDYSQNYQEQHIGYAFFLENVVANEPYYNYETTDD